jgi:hypothetical protein
VRCSATRICYLTGNAAEPACLQSYLAHLVINAREMIKQSYSRDSVCDGRYDYGAVMGQETGLHDILLQLIVECVHSEIETLIRFYEYAKRKVHSLKII